MTRIHSVRRLLLFVDWWLAGLLAGRLSCPRRVVAVSRAHAHALHARSNASTLSKIRFASLRKPTQKRWNIGAIVALTSSLLICFLIAVRAGVRVCMRACVRAYMRPCGGKQALQKQLMFAPA